MLDLPIDDHLKEVIELVGGKKRVDFHDEELVVTSKPQEDHIPEWVVKMAHPDFFDSEVDEILKHEKDQTVIICIVDNLRKYGLIVD